MLAPAQKSLSSHNLTQGKIFSKLLLFSFPFMATNLMTTLYTLVDLAVIGHFLGDAALSAASISGQLTLMLYTVGVGLGSGGQTLISQYIGAGRRDELQKTIGTLFSFKILGAFVLMLVGVVCSSPLLHLLNAPTQVFKSAQTYLIICCLGLIPHYIFLAFSSVLRGTGDSRTPFKIIAISSCLNVGLDVLFIAVFRMGVAGAAWATLVSQMCSACLSIIFLKCRATALEFDFVSKSFRIDKAKLKILIKLGIPLVASSLCVTLSLMFINRYVNSYGIVASAVNGVGSKLSTIMHIVTHAMQAATSTFVGQNMGAQKPQRAQRAVLGATAITFVFWAIMTTVYIKFPHVVFGLFTDSNETLALAARFLRIYIWMYLGSALLNPVQGLMIGVGATRLNLGITLLDGVVRVGLSLLFGNVLDFGLYGYWIGSSIAIYVAVSLCWIYFLSMRWKNRKLI